MSPLPSPAENPSGLHQKYIITRADGKPVDPNGVYFVLRLDGDHLHNVASRRAARQWVTEVLKQDEGKLSQTARELSELIRKIDPPKGFVFSDNGEEIERRYSEGDYGDEGEEENGDFSLADQLRDQVDELAEPVTSPVEKEDPRDPEEWVVQDRMPSRDRVDQFRWASWQRQDEWRSVEHYWYASGKMHGSKSPCGSTLMVRCRRKDLPPLPASPAEVKEEFPQYWTSLDSLNGPGAYVQRDSQETYRVIDKDGGCRWMGLLWTDDDQKKRSRLTKEEAEALLGNHWPKFYIHRDPSAKWFIRRNEDGTRTDVTAVATVNGPQRTAEDRIWNPHAEKFVESGEWLQVKEWKAMARVTDGLTLKKGKGEA